jgi:23S rRNA pseudouridine2605 synthase
VRIKLLREAENPWFEITMIEGRNRQLRRMFEQIGNHVEKIKRVKYGPLELDVEPGKFRPLTPQEVDRLKNWTKVSKRPPQIEAPELKPRAAHKKAKR